MTVDIAIHGGGYTGLTAAIHFALAGQTVMISDPDPLVCAGINTGNPKAGEFLGYLGQHTEAFARIRATQDVTETRYALVHLLSVPTERNGEPYMDIVLSVLQQLVHSLPPQPFTEVPPPLLLVESTLTPGTLDRFLSTLSDTLRRGLGQTWHLAHAPRRDWFADPNKNLQSLKRIVGGVTEACTARAMGVLSHVSDQMVGTTYSVAELTKPLENALLAVPAMLCHELATAYPAHDVAEAVKLATTHWRLFPLYLNFGLGGRCVPLGPKYLTAGTSYPLTLAERATRLNAEFPQQIAAMAERLAGAAGRILVLGLGYRPEFRDVGSSPGLAIARWLATRHAAVMVDDPLFSPEELAVLVPGAAVRTRYPSQPLHGEPLTPGQQVHRADVIVLATPHAIFKDYPFLEGAWHPMQVILDAQGAWGDPRARMIFKARGVDYRQVGKPGWNRIGIRELHKKETT